MQLQSDRLILRRFEASDWEDLYEYLSLPEVVFYEPYEAYTKEQCIQEAKYRSEEENNRFWAVCLKDSNKMIGNVYFAQVQPQEFMTWELGYVFNPKYYGNGYATEACKRMLDYAFGDLNAHRVTAGVNIKNAPSWRLLERLNMRREAHMLQNVFFRRNAAGEPLWNDSYRYAVLAQEYIKK